MEFGKSWWRCTPGLSVPLCQVSWCWRPSRTGRVLGPREAERELSAPGFPSSHQPKSPFKIAETIAVSLPLENPQLLFNKAADVLKCVFLLDFEQFRAKS